jgi:tetratricopeptide (TPR) repeat protein
MTKLLTKTAFLIATIVIFSSTTFALPNPPSNTDVLKEITELKTELAEYKIAKADNQMELAEKTIDWFIGLSTTVVAILALFVAIAGIVGWKKLVKQDKVLLEIKVEHLSAKANRILHDLKGQNNQTKTNEAIELLDEAIKSDPNHYASLYDRACAYSLQGNKKNAIRDLGKAFAISDKNKDWAKTDSDLYNIRNTPEFKELVGIEDGKSKENK